MSYEIKDILLSVLIATIIYNGWRHNNKFFVTSMTIFIAFYLYGQYCLVYNTPEHKRTKREEEYLQKKELNRLVEHFAEEYKDHTLEDIFKMPAKFKYLFVRSGMWKNLLQLKFVGNFDKFAYAKLFGLLEQFFRLFYRAISDRDNISLTIENMKQIQQKIKTLIGEYKLNVPLVSRKYSELLKRSKHKTLHDLIDKEMKDINKILIKKIKMVQALIENKI